MTIELRTAQPDDVESMRAIRRAAILGVQTDLDPSVRDAWAARRSTDAFTERTAAGGVLIASEDGEDVAWGSSEGSHISGLYVCPAYSRRGIGRTLLLALEAMVGQRGHRLVRLESTLNAVGFYSKHGYAQAGSVRVDGTLPMSKYL